MSFLFTWELSSADTTCHCHDKRYNENHVVLLTFSKLTCSAYTGHLSGQTDETANVHAQPQMPPQNQNKCLKFLVPEAAEIHSSFLALYSEHLCKISASPEVTDIC